MSYDLTTKPISRYVLDAAMSYYLENPIEQIWEELRKSFCNQVFVTLDKVMEKLCDAICHLSKATIQSITAEIGVLNRFN